MSDMIKDLKAYLDSKGVKVSEKEAEGLLKFFESGKDNKLTGNAKALFDKISSSKELSEDELTAVAGGMMSMPMPGEELGEGSDIINIGVIGYYYGFNWYENACKFKSN